MRQSVWGVAAALLLLVAACSSLSVSSDYDRSMLASFPAYETYSWLEQEGDFVVDGTRVSDDIVAGRIRSAVDDELARKGYRLDISGTPDFLVGYHVALQGKMDVTTVDDYYGYGWRGTDTDVYEYTEGTLVLDFIDAGKEALVWRGTAQAEVKQDQSPEKREERIRAAVHKILERFPPEVK